jgi:predicted NBD/HSP70 family sugar kinase
MDRTYRHGKFQLDGRTYPHGENALATMEIRLTPTQQCKRRDEIERRIDAITKRRVDVSDRLGVGVAVPGAVPVREMATLRNERAALEQELDEALSALHVLRRCMRG